MKKPDTNMPGVVLASERGEGLSPVLLPLRFCCKPFDHFVVMLVPNVFFLGGRGGGYIFHNIVGETIYIV